MKIIGWRSLLIGSTVLATGVAVGALLRRGLRARADGDLARGAARVAAEGGIMPIDPEPITQIAGEGIDLDARTARPGGLDEILEHASPARLA